MKIVLACVGSRGDVQPYVALGTGLRNAGHQVTIATHMNFESLVASQSLGFELIRGNIHEMLHSEAGHQWLAAGSSPIKFFTGIVRLTSDFFAQITTDLLHACRNAEAIIYSPLALCVDSIAEKMSVPSCMATLQPVSPTRAFASPMFPQKRLGGMYNLFTHFASRQFVWQPFRSQFNQWRREALQLSPYGFWGPLVRMQKENAPALCGFSSHVVPRPGDWRSACHITGYWFLDQPDYTPAPQLLDFIRSGKPPVYIGFGSMSERDPENTFNLLVKALRLSKQRGILLSGWADLPQNHLHDDIFVIDSVPHDWLFPKMRGVVHHAGAGTTAAVFRAGVPNIAIPFFGDQNFWAERVLSLRTGPKPIPRKRLTAENLAAAIQQAIDDPQIKKNAAELGDKIRAENGVATAIELLQSKLL